jgi:hypothetical protein
MNFSIFDLYESEVKKDASLHYPYTYPNPPRFHARISTPDSVSWEDTEVSKPKPSIKPPHTAIKPPPHLHQSLNEFVPECYLDIDTEPSSLHMLIKERWQTWKPPQEYRVVKSSASLKPSLSKIVVRRDSKKYLIERLNEARKTSIGTIHQKGVFSSLQTKPAVTRLPKVNNSEIRAYLRIKGEEGVRTVLAGRSLSHENTVEKKRSTCLSVFPARGKKPGLRPTF